MNHCSYRNKGLRSEMTIITIHFLASHNYTEVREYIMDYLVDNNLEVMVLDLGQLQSIGPLGMGMIFSIFDSCNEMNKKFCLMQPNKNIKKRLQLMNLNAPNSIVSEDEQLIEILEVLKEERIFKKSMK